jgi:hypothetical protein
MTKALAGLVGRRGGTRTSVGPSRELQLHGHLNAKSLPIIAKLLSTLFTCVATATITPAAAHAAAGGLLTIGMKLTFGNRDCSLGFFATDSVRDQLAVTAGHCANGLREKVYNTFGQQIGEVVAWQPDALDSHGKLTGSRGFTVVHIHRNFAIEPFFSRVGAAHIGDHVRLSGERTGGTNGTITDVSYTAGHPDLDLLTSNVEQLPGDSGGALYTTGPTLVGIASSTKDGAGEGVGRAEAQPVGSVVQEIMAVGRYGRGFSVNTKG